MDWLAALGLLAVGLTAGALSTLFGIGGGLVMVPVLHYIGGLGFHRATALSLLCIALQSPTGVWQHARRGAVDWRLAAPLAVAGLAGVALGIYLEPRVPVPWLKVVLALLMALAAYRMVARSPERMPGEAPKRPGLAYLALVGVLAGVTSNLLGIGGGLVTVPMLALANVPAHTAVGSSLVPVFTNAAVASGESLASGLDWLPAIPLAVGGLAGNPFGARFAHSLDEKGLRKVFAGALVLGALYVGLTSGVV